MNNKFKQYLALTIIVLAMIALVGSIIGILIHEYGLIGVIITLSIVVLSWAVIVYDLK